MTPRARGIEQRLDQGTAPTDEEVRWLLERARRATDAEETIRVLTTAAMDFIRAYVELTERRPDSPKLPVLHLGVFKEHAERP